jgi:hypothetical protein
MIVSCVLMAPVTYYKVTEAIMNGKRKIDLSSLEEKWPSAFVAREVSKEFTGGLVSPKSLANLDSQGEGPAGAIRCGRKVIYPVKSFIEWLEKRSKIRSLQTDDRAVLKSIFCKNRSRNQETQKKEMI